MTHRECPHCGNRRPDSDFRHANGRAAENCADCRVCDLVPPATDPERVRRCWYCSEEFATTDFTERMCSGICRKKYFDRSDNDGALPSAKEAPQMTATMRRIGVPKERRLPGEVA